MIPRIEHILMLFLPWAAAAAMGQDSLRTLPAGDDWPRTREAWQALQAERDALPGGTFPKAFPEYADHFYAMQERLPLLTDKYLADNVAYNEALATALVSELYIDMGHPALNSGAHDFIISGIIADVGRWPEERLPDGARQRLTDGLLAYVEAGGGQWMPAAQAWVASALDALAGEKPEVRAMVEFLLEDSLAWAEEVDCDVMRQSVYRQCEQLWGDVFRLRAYEAQAPDLPEKRPKSYERACAALVDLLREGDHRSKDFAMRLKDATDAALKSLDDPALADDLTCRLLVVYRALLERRPVVAARVSGYIDQQLLRLAARGDRMRQARHWKLWSEAVVALRSWRMSRSLSNYIRAMLAAKDLPAERREAADRVKHVLSPK